MTRAFLVAAVLAAWAMLGAVVPGALAQGSQPSDEAVRRVARQLQCPVCEGQTVADSNAGLAQDMRTVIRQKLAAGESERSIIDGFVAAYGESILSEPPRHGLGLLVWGAPIVVLLGGLAVVAVLVRRWSASAAPRVAAQDPAGAVSPPPAVLEEMRRFREEASR